MPISDFGNLRGRPLTAGLDEVSGYSGWDVADRYKGSIALNLLAIRGPPERFRRLVEARDRVITPARVSDDDRPRYDVEKLGRLIQALQNDELYVAAIDDHTRDEVRVPKGFWSGDWTYYRDRHLVALDVNRRPSGLVYLVPWLVVPQTGAPMRRAWEIAEDILKDPDAPLGETALARLVQSRLKAAGHDLKEGTIARYIRLGLKEYKKKHPER